MARMEKTFLAADGTRRPRPAWVAPATGVLIACVLVGAAGVYLYPPLMLLGLAALWPLVYVKNYWRT